MKSYLLSALAPGFAGQQLPALARLYPPHWLVWEAGVWRPPAQATVAISRESITKASGAEGLAMALLSPDGKPLTLGRAPESELPVNDATLSRAHLRLRPTGTSWSVEEAGSSNGTLINGRPLRPGVPMLLASGDKLAAGDVTLTFLTLEGLFNRVTALFVRSSPPGRR
ncbi:MAG: FHA domain-containing protein [Myxococcaceae bacterium]|nr:FHA domain-containing protein [Myxococcaceae bacterium]